MIDILVAVDFSEVSKLMMAEAKKLARGREKDTKIWLIHVAAPEPDFVGYEVGPQYIRDARADELREEHRHLQDMQHELEKEGYQSTALLIPGVAADVLLEESTRIEADYIVIGSHGRSALFDALLGSVTQNIVRKALTPVVVVPYPKA